MMRFSFARVASVLLAVALLIGCQQATSTPGRSTDDAAVDTDPADSTQARFNALMDVAKTQDLHDEPLGVIMTTLGQEAMGAPYLAGTLDEPPTEQLVIRFDGYDCVTFVETMLALARGVEQQQYDYASFARRIEEQRYREGELDGYCSRMHYFTEWIAQNDQRGTVRSITQQLGGVPLTDSLSFMSTHRDAYPRFATNDSLLACVRGMEAQLSGTTIYHVPQDDIRSVYDQLQSGDIIGFSTDIGGLDVAHTGLVLKDGDQARLLHASLSNGVVVSPDLQRYVQNIGHQVGIVVARPLSSRGS